MQTAKPKRRVDLDKPLKEIVLDMAEGNPGAIICCTYVAHINALVDPDDFGGPVGALVKLDSLGIYGHRISILLSDVCGNHAGTLIAVLRANQLRLAGVTNEALNHAIDHHGEGLDVKAAIRAVQDRLPKFNINAGTTETPKENAFKSFLSWVKSLVN